MVLPPRAVLPPRVVLLLHVVRHPYAVVRHCVVLLVFFVPLLLAVHPAVPQQEVRTRQVDVVGHQHKALPYVPLLRVVAPRGGVPSCVVRHHFVGVVAISRAVADTKLLRWRILNAQTL